MLNRKSVCRLVEILVGPVLLAVFLKIRCTGNFLVYNLRSSTLAKSAYCFGTGVECTDGKYSETGYSPGCTSKYMLFYEE